VVLDSMVWAQAIAARFTKRRGPAAEILDLALDGHFQLMISAHIRSETISVLKHDPYFKRRLDQRLDPEGTFDILAMACGDTVEAVGSSLLPGNAKDDPILWVAGAGLASHLVSRDQALLNLKHYRFAQILTPPAFLRAWRAPRVSEPLSNWKSAMRATRQRRRPGLSVTAG
jgi:predicted nucleic acid-binding protein